MKGKEKDHPLSIHWFIHFPNTYFLLSVLDLWHFKQRIKQVLNAPLMNTTAFPFTELKEKRMRQRWAGIDRKNGQRNMSRKYKSWMPKDKRDGRLTSTYSFSWYTTISISPSPHHRIPLICFWHLLIPYLDNDSLNLLRSTPKQPSIGKKCFLVSSICQALC